MKKKIASNIARQLNEVIHNQNLYKGHSRFIDAKVVGEIVTVENLQTGARTTFDNDRWRNGFGSPIKFSDAGRLL